MPNRTFQRNTMIDLLTRVPVNRGSLLKSIDNLLKTIETSENAVMIPTLLKDKVRVDAWELLFVAKILKASVLGHSDLVEFYLNHIHSNSNHAGAAAAAASAANGEPLLSPSSSITRQQSSPNMGAAAHSPSLLRHNTTPQLVEGLVLQTNGVAGAGSPQPQHQQHTQRPSPSSSSSSSSGSSSATTTTHANTTGGLAKTPVAPLQTSMTTSGGSSSSTSTANSKQSSASYATANSRPLEQQAAAGGASLSSSSFTSANSSSANTTSNNSSASSSSSNSSSSGSSSSSSGSEGATAINLQPSHQRATFQISDCAMPPEGPLASIQEVVGERGPLATPPPTTKLAPPTNSSIAAAVRQAQPPSLLQLTTTNNHINSVSEMFNNSPLSPSLELLSNHLIQLQQQASANAAVQSNNNTSAASVDQATTTTTPSGALSISTSSPSVAAQAEGQNQLSAPTAAVAPPASVSGATTGAPTPPATRHELRSSRSAGCLFRANSGASSPRTPGTPYPQAETLSGSAGPTGLVGDPSSLVKLLLQVEQLKTSIVQVTSLLDSVVELYKKSIDNIAV